MNSLKSIKNTKSLERKVQFWEDSYHAHAKIVQVCDDQYYNTVGYNKMLNHLKMAIYCLEIIIDSRYKKIIEDYC